MKQTTLRYTPGEKYYFINLDFEPNSVRFVNLYLPWEDKLNKITIIELLCAEHHPVASYHEPNGEKKYDGFIFRQENAEHQSSLWNNQYPTASYGQISTKADYMVRADYSLKEIEKIPCEKLREQFEDVTILIERILRGQKDLTKDGRRKEAESLGDFLKQIEEELKKFNLKVVTKPTEFKRLDGTIAVYEDIREVILVKDEDSVIS